MSKSLRIVGRDHWIRRAIEQRTVVAVTDGLYMRDIHPHACSAAGISKDSQGDGSRQNSNHTWRSQDHGLPLGEKDADHYLSSRQSITDIFDIHLHDYPPRTHSLQEIPQGPGWLTLSARPRSGRNRIGATRPKNLGENPSPNRHRFQGQKKGQYRGLEKRRSRGQRMGERTSTHRKYDPAELL